MLQNMLWIGQLCFMLREHGWIVSTQNSCDRQISSIPKDVGFNVNFSSIEYNGHA